MPRGIVNRRDKFNWDNCHMPDGQSLPRVTTDDSGKILTVDENGKWSADESEVSKEITNAGIAHFADAANAPLADLKVDIKAVQAGSGDPSPTNVRPITGFSSVVVNRTGKNLCNYDTISAISVGTINRNGMFFTKPGKYSVSGKNKGAYVYCRIFNADGTIKDTYYIVQDQSLHPSTFTIANGEYFAIYDASEESVSSSKVVFTSLQIQVELSDAPTAYEPYNANVYTITMPASEGSVYGGTLDVLTGKLTVDRATVVFNGTENYSSFPNDIVCNKAVPVGFSVTGDDIISSHATRNQIHFASNSKDRVQFSKSFFGVSDVDELKSYLQAQNTAGTPLQYSYKLATPVVYNLTPTEVYSLLGENNIFANSGDILSVSYVTREYAPLTAMIEDKTTRFFDAVEDSGTYDVSLVGATSTDVKNYLLTHPNASIVIRVKRYSTILLYYLREYSPNYFAEFATPANIFEAEDKKSMRIDYLRLDLTQETSDFTNDSIIIPST